MFIKSQTLWPIDHQLVYTAKMQEAQVEDGSESTNHCNESIVEHFVPTQDIGYRNIEPFLNMF